MHNHVLYQNFIIYKFNFNFIHLFLYLYKSFIISKYSNSTNLIHHLFFISYSIFILKNYYKLLLIYKHSNSIHQIYEGEKIHSPADYSKEDLNKFVESLDSKAFKSVNKFFDTMPKLKQEVELENPKTKVKSKSTLSGLQDFFVSPSLTNR